jgi:gluconolactonase
MKNIVLFLIVPLLLCTACSEKKKKAVESDFSIEILDDEALGLLGAHGDIQEIGSGFEWTEGPLWIEDGKYLLFSDIPNNKIFKIDAKGETSEYLNPAGYTGSVPRGGELGSNGLLLNQNGELVLLQHGDRRVAKMMATIDDPKPVFESIVDNYEGKKFNSPNDAVYDGEGNLYFTDPPYGLPERMDDPTKELDFQGVYCLKTSGELVLVDTLTRPNGIAFSPDGTKLYVAVSDPEHAVWYAYDVIGTGEVKNKTLFYDATSLIGKKGQQGLPDGMKMHSKGYLFATGPGGVWIFNSSGKPIARIYTGQATANCAFNADESVLFLTADDYVLKVRLN